MGNEGDELASTDREGSWRELIRRSMTIVGAASITIVLLIVLGRAIDVVLVTFAGVLLGIFLLALRDGVARYTMLPKGLALAIVILVLSAVVIGGVLGFAPRIAEQLDELSERLPQFARQARGSLEQHAWGRRLLQLVAQDDALGDVDLVSIATFGTELFVFMVGFLVVGFFVAIQPRLYVDGLVALFPLPTRARAREIVEEMGLTLRWFLVARAIAMVLVGISTAILLQILDIPGASLLATVAGLFTFVPYLGPIAAGIPILVVSLFEGPREAALAVGIYTVIQSIEGYVFDPLIMQRVVRIPPAVTLVAQILGGVLLGVLGIVLAMPIAAVLQVAIRRAYREDLLGEQLERPESVDRDAPLHDRPAEAT